VTLAYFRAVREPEDVESNPMINIVTVEREYGSGGGEVAALLAKRLGWKLWDQELTEEIARLANCPKSVVEGREEKTDPLYYRLFKSFLRGSYEGSINAHKLKMVDSESIMRITERVVRQVADAGNCVIVGRGSQHFLDRQPGTLRVFLYACRQDKVRRVMATGKTEAEARELVDTVDQERSDFIQKYFNVEWPSRSLYHLMVNTSVGEEVAVQAIVDFMTTVKSRREQQGVPANCA
jgi:cytidylate kinase